MFMNSAMNEMLHSISQIQMSPKRFRINVWNNGRTKLLFSNEMSGGVTTGQYVQPQRRRNTDELKRGKFELLCG